MQLRPMEAQEGGTGGDAMKFQARRFVRHRLEVPVRFSWIDRHGARHRAEGKTRDISPGGVFLSARACPPAGTPVGLSIFLPPLSEHIPSWKMQTKGRVVRVEPSGSKGRLGGFAAISDKISVRVLDNYA
jgi:hypothetical protein